MRVLDLFCGLKGWSQSFADNGWEVETLDNDPKFDPDYCMDIRDFKPAMEYDVVLASPPCETFSVMSIGTHWGGGTRAYQPKTEAARVGMDLVWMTVQLIHSINPTFFVIENPRGVLRKLDLIPYERRTVWYCRYGRPYAKPTDLWGGFPPSLVLKPECHNGNEDHVRAPRGSRTGIQGGQSREERAKVPYALSDAVRLACERDHDA